MRRTLLSLLVLVASSGVVSLDGQAPAQPAFRAGTTVVEVSAIVTKDGVPVADLRADEVVVLDNGKPQELVAFEFVDLGRVEGPAQRRDFVLVLDDLHIAAEQSAPTIDAALALVDALGPYDRLAVSTTGAVNLSFEFSTQREAARETIRKFRGQMPRGQYMAGRLGGAEASARSRIALAVLGQICEAVRSDTAERRALLLFSTGYVELRPDIGNRDTQNIWPDYLELLREAALGNVAIYTVDPRGLRAPNTPAPWVSGGPPTMGSPTALASDVTGSNAILALNTGGVQTRWTNDLTAGYAQLLQDSRQYYRLAYVQPEPAPGKAQPQTRGIKVKVTRPGVDVRARQRYAPARDAS